MATLEFVWTELQFDRFRRLIHDRSGLHFADDKRQAIERGVAQAMQATSCCHSLDEYYELLRVSPSSSREWDALVGELTIGETYFFRNKTHFDALANHILPEIIEQRRYGSRRIRIWSAGCSTGEEPYSVAILLKELIPDLASWNVLILATDINRYSLQKAREGVYGSWSFRGVEKRIQEQYFHYDGQRSYAIDESIKRMVTFDYLNLVEDSYPSLLNGTHGMDIILCRNVTIYFTPEVTQRVVDKFYQSLVEGGWLIPGSSEPNLVPYQSYLSRSLPGTVVYRRVTTKEPKPAPLEWMKQWPFTVDPAAPELVQRPAGNGAAGSSAPINGESAHSASGPFAPKAPPPEPPKPIDPFETALDLLAQGRADEALKKLYEKLDRNPDHVPTYYTLGKIYANQGNLEQAQQWCEKAIERDKLHPEPYFTLSMVYQGNGFTDKAIEALKKTLYLDPTFALGHYTLANLYMQLGQKELAQRSLRNAQRLLAGRPRDELVPEGDGMVVGRLMALVEMMLKS